MIMKLPTRSPEGTWYNKQVDIPEYQYKAAINGDYGSMAQNYAKDGIYDPTLMDPDLNSKLKSGASMDEVYKAERAYAARTGIPVGDIGKEEAAQYRAAHSEVSTQEIGGSSQEIGGSFSAIGGADSNQLKQVPEMNSFNQVPQNDLYGMLQSILKFFNQFLSQNGSFRPF